ncbi:uncharacterized protein [Miscanthus floridulus]|uniref:uncharacterized protein n=1 Tax=Miscanthus floridulus TaxID=154761 RepID=UPI003458A7A6
MIDILRAEQWWDEWQLRILILGSLGLQWFLLLAAPMRNYTIPRLFRFSIWAAYVSADALAIYALATLFNRHAKASSSSGGGCDYGTKGSSLEVLWAPLLLVYLGGREEITAYTIEDNELWTRQTVTMVSQVTVAVYSFYKSWPDSSDRKLLLSAILLFVIGIISFIEKPWALRRASIKRLVAMSSVMRGKRESPGGWDWCFTELGDRYRCWKDLPEGDVPILSQGDKVQMILSDQSLYAAKVTLETRAPQRDGQEILEEPNAVDNTMMKRLVRQAFGIIYTRANVIFTPAYLACHVMLVPSLYIAAIMLFAASRKHGYGAADVKTTYVLLCFTAVLDVFGLLISELMYRLMFITKLPALCENIAGFNLVDSVLRTMKRPVIGSLQNYSRRFGYYKEGKYHSLYRTVSDFISAELARVTTSVKNADFSSYRSFTSTDFWTEQQKKRLLKPYATHGTTMWKSLREMPFDASVLIWHIATDLCFRSRPPKHFSWRPPRAEVLREVCTEAISNYMAYLLVHRPEMLMAGSRQHLFTEATQHMERIFREGTRDFRPNLREKQPFDDAILEMIMEKAARLKHNDQYAIINDACMLAKELLGIQEEKTRWELMHRVWVGMLCYSASMCRGYLHAKSLGEGGEFLSYVWLIISLRGAKTLADKLQMPADKEPGDDDEEDKRREQGQEMMETQEDKTREQGQEMMDTLGRLLIG